MPNYVNAVDASISYASRTTRFKGIQLRLLDESSLPYMMHLPGKRSQYASIHAAPEKDPRLKQDSRFFIGPTDSRAYSLRSDL